MCEAYVKQCTNESRTSYRQLAQPHNLHRFCRPGLNEPTNCRSLLSHASHSQSIYFAVRLGQVNAGFVRFTYCKQSPPKRRAVM